ncbi:MAG: PP2C family protein-serine/threonine phosphatase [Acidobacteria bacterium]|nr:PP2C family protein-serine/threonine phosphatase [Acidobacteriota bacterium]
MNRRSADSIRRRPDFRALYKKLESTLERIECKENVSQMLSGVLKSLVGDFKDWLGFEGGRLYQRQGEYLVLCSGHGTSAGAPPGYRIPPTYEPHRRLLSEGLIIVGPDDPGFDPEIEGPIGVTSAFAAMAVGEGNTHVIAFSIREPMNEEHVLSSLNAARHAINLRLHQRRLTDILEESRIIQESLLPSSPPAFDGYDIYGSSRPTEIVGGDVFDYLPLSPDLLGVAIADASGHGLPAALLARDVITGLRVAMTDDLKVVKVIERLNRVIHRAAHATKFISLFYGELEANGTFVYCNAGHNPPFLVRRRTCRELRSGDLVLGPSPDARYERGHVRLENGDMIVMYTDGLTERRSRMGRQFGKVRLRDLLRGSYGLTSRQLVDAIFAATEEFAQGNPQQDDVTLVVVRKV